MLTKGPFMAAVSRDMVSTTLRINNINDIDLGAEDSKIKSARNRKS
jgi:hypothetical protein